MTSLIRSFLNCTIPLDGRFRAHSSLARSIAMKSRAAVAFAPDQPLQIVEIDVETPRKGEVLVKITHTALCHTDTFTLSGADPEGLSPVVLGHEGAGVVVEVGEANGRAHDCTPVMHAP